MHVRLYIFSPGLGVERQWIRHTDLKQARTRVKTGEGRDLCSSNATDPQHVKAVLNRLESGAAFAVMSENGAEARLMGACGACRPTDRTRLIKMRAVRNPVCNTPKASSANAGRIERASQKVEKRSRTSTSSFEGVSAERVYKVMPDRMRNCAWQITRRLARPGTMKHVERSCGRAYNGQVSEVTEMSHFREPQKADECSLRLWKGTVMVDTAGADPSGDAQRLNDGTESR